MLEIVRERRPADGVIGEEIGSHPEPGSRRWILDGIDGTHNYADGRPGWGSVIALEVDGAVTLGLVSAPALARRWWAIVDEGAWTAARPDDGPFDPAAADAAPGLRPGRPGRGVGDRPALDRGDGGMARSGGAPVHPADVAAQPVARAGRGDGRRRRARRRHPHVRRRLGLRRHQPDRARGRRCVPRRVGRRADGHGDRGVHQRGARRPGAGGAGDDAPPGAGPPAARPHDELADRRPRRCRR